MPTLKLRNMIKVEDPIVGGSRPKCDIIIDGLGNPEIIRDKDALAQQAVYCLRTRTRPDSTFGSDVSLLRGEKIETLVKPFGVFTTVLALVNLKKIQDNYLRDVPDHPLTEVIKSLKGVNISTDEKIRVKVSIDLQSQADEPVSATPEV